ncbi:hypothetical protein TH63_02315 [Rufibacter radiotolerans]|uniref:Oxygen sensor histidine kinase NreB n=1 Tax=Rufibacter radiotolerans TaxID=1379910 RepID=A0A0H4VLD3_9BACT|nr:PAS domain-containing protein [Rufibacter radiotolerans]AKQ44722.1 hypothetical protein TH63_02315 [Rufibacter radiotolerans]
MALKTVGPGVVSHKRSESNLKALQKEMQRLKLNQAQITEPESEVLSVILEDCPDLYLLLTPELQIKWVSNAYLNTTGRSREELIGKFISEIYPPEASSAKEAEFTQELQDSLTQVLTTGNHHEMGLHRSEQPAPPGEDGDSIEKFWRVLHKPVVNETGEIISIIHKMIDVTALVQKQRLIEGLTQEREAIQAALGQAQTVQQKLREEQRRLKQAEACGHLGSFEVVFPERVVFCSDELFRIYGMEPQSEPIIFEGFSSYIHPDDRDRYKQAVHSFYQENRSLDLIHRIIRQDGQTRIVHTRSETVLDVEGREVSIFGTMQDITEQKLAQDQLEASTAVLRQAEAVGHTGSYEADVATMVLHCSDEMYRLLGYEPQSLEITLDFVDANSHPDDAAQIRQQLQNSLATKEPYQYVRRIYWPDGQMRYIEGKGTVVCNEEGEAVKLVGTIHDITDQVRTDLILDTINEVCYELDEQLRFRYANKTAYTTWGKVPDEILGKEYLEVFPEAKEYACFQMILQVHQTKKQALKEVYDPFEKKWLFYNVMPAHSGLIVLYFDITEKVEALEEISQKQEQLNLLVESVPDLISRWSKDGTCVYCNSNFESKFNLEPGSAEGKKAFEIGSPSETVISFMSCLKEVFASGQPKDSAYEFRLQGEPLSLVAHLIPERAPDGSVETVLVIAYDMTQVWQAKSEINKHLNLLKQSEELAGLGSWEYDISSGTITWSEGMCRLFKVEQGHPGSPEVYLQYVLDEDLEIAQRIVENLRVHHQPFEETLRIKYPHGIKILRMKGVVVEGSDGKPAKILGVDWDITEMERLVNENEKIKLSQQNELLLAILDTQETERLRIAEALHNGIAQLMYAVKLNLNQVILDRKAMQDRQVKECVGKADRILVKAIQEVRSLSHELMPTPLSDLGLEAAFKDICATLSSKNLQLNCWVFNLHTPLEKHLELAVYRIAQELANNMVKHAQATEASLLLREQRGVLVLEAEDNGKGFNPLQLTGKGMGLKSIQDRVKLLNGTVEIETEPDQGTSISIYIPIPATQGPKG